MDWRTLHVSPHGPLPVMAPCTHGPLPVMAPCSHGPLPVMAPCPHGRMGHMGVMQGHGVCKALCKGMVSKGSCLTTTVRDNGQSNGQFTYGLNKSMTGIVTARCDPAAAQWAVVWVGMPVKMTE
eukprot:354621-Chlamydomonas_euryale.AAC.3